jgi:uncharacterized protein YqgQ
VEVIIVMTTTRGFSINTIKDEARQLVEEGLVERHQPIYALCRFIAPNEWLCIECELERNDFLLRDPILDLLGREEWEND